MTTELAAKADHLRALHHSGTPLVLANAWDVRSARIVVGAGYPVVATSSAAVVTALGYRDGGHKPTEVAFAVLTRISGAVEVPVTADIEDGYSLSPDDLAESLIGSGVVGCNLEDSDHTSGGEALVDGDQFRDAAGRAQATGVCVRGRPRRERPGGRSPPPGGPHGRATGRGARRARLYVDAGADCIYPITVSEKETARAMVTGLAHRSTCSREPRQRMWDASPPLAPRASAWALPCPRWPTSGPMRWPASWPPRCEVMSATGGAGDGRHRVVIIGCGFGGLFAARALRRAPVDVTVIDRTNHHLFQPLLYQVATGILSEGEIAPAIRDVLRRQRNVHVQLGEVTDIDLDARSVTCVEHDAVRAAPVRQPDRGAGHAHRLLRAHRVRTLATGLKSLDDALEVRGRVFRAFELAETEPDPLRRAALSPSR